MIRNVLKQREKVTKNYQYFVLYSQNKWGVINQDGDEVIQPSYQEMIVIPNKEKDVFICTYDVDENSGTYKTKAINEKNNIIIAPDGITGNIIFRTLVLVNQWPSMGAITLGIPEIYIDTSRDQSEEGYERSIKLAYQLAKKQ